MTGRKACPTGVKLRFHYDPAMRWILHLGLSNSVADALKRHDQTIAPESDGEKGAPEEFLRLAQKKQLDIVTADAGLARLPFEAETGFARVMVYLQLPRGEVEQDDAIDRLFARYKRLTPGRLYTVTENRVKIRQLPARKG
jgi:hypothetical protein